MSRYSRQPWDSCLVLHNGQVVLAVNPWIGRIVWFSRHDKPNVLWMNNPEGVVQGKPADAWYNWGGDKVWLGPQPRWPEMLGQGWPPDEATDLWPWTVNRTEERRLVMTSPVSRHTLTQVTREIELAPDQPTVRIRHTLRRVPDVSGPEFQNARGVKEPLQIWTVTQVRPPQYVLLDADTGHPAAKTPVYVMVPPGGAAPTGLRVLEDGRLIQAPAWDGANYKVGVMGRWLAAVFAEDILVEFSRPQPAGRYPEHSNLQWFLCAPYGELETLTALTQVQSGQEIVDEIHWRLLSNKPGRSAHEIRAEIERVRS